MSLDLDAIRQRLEAAPAGPWEVSPEGDAVWNGAGWVADVAGDGAAFVAHAREDLPALIAALEAARVALRRVEWGGRDAEHPDYCPVCYSDAARGHDADCELGSALGGMTAGGHCAPADPAP